MRILFAIALILSATTAGAQDFKSGNYRMAGCRAAIADRATYNSGYCLGLVDGIVFGEAGHDTFCIPGTSAGTGVTLMQIVRVVVAYIDARSARMHEDFRTLALLALIDAWPCKR
jgi:hypothetical protein